VGIGCGNRVGELGVGNRVLWRCVKCGKWIPISGIVCRKYDDIYI